MRFSHVAIALTLLASTLAVGMPYAAADMCMSAVEHVTCALHDTEDAVDALGHAVRYCALNEQPPLLGADGRCLLRAHP